MAFYLVLASLGSWTLFYFLLCHLAPKRGCEWHCRTVTTIHAILITVLSAWCSFVQGPWPFTDAGGPNTHLQTFTTSICLGYFVFDISWCLYFQTEGPGMLTHHIMSIIGFVVSLILGKYGTELVATIFAAEITNPLLQLRWFLRATNRYNTILGEVVDHLFMFSFAFMRLGLGSVLLYCYFQQPTDYLGRFGALCIYSISWMFWIAIVQYAVKKYKKKWRMWKEKRDKLSNGSIAAKGFKTTETGVETVKHRNGFVQNEKTVLGESIVTNGHVLNHVEDKKSL